MKLQPASPITLTKRGCPLAFDVMDADHPEDGIIGRATYERWATRQGVVEYTVVIRRGDSCLMGPLLIRHPHKF